ncbi:MAG: HPr(Ser) kinase/phosphatase [Oscillospiraceae bacterium]|nr:HPr(Ser) kinase/phosphatase [Oscillospiraceae bacterium]MDD3832811.1 HPr(Ser) kinase/phosphatase [Oscillospiraceae bacterium]MDD4546354.1 HPr(Ser) kinase/phosphatase [Oscillospiraceae bacterium]
MTKSFTVSLQEIIQETVLETIYMPAKPDEILISSGDLNRPGLQFSGYFDYFDSARIQMLGKSEVGFLEDLEPKMRRTRIDEFVSHRPPAVILCRDLEVLPELLECCQKFNVPLLRSPEPTSSFMASLIAYLNVQLAPRITRHGVFVEVYGEGILLIGDSGVGKSETAIELIKRGHRLIADDAVEIRKVSSKTLVGSAPANIRHFIELRGIGIVNARRIFGMGSVKITEKIDMAIQLEQWVDSKVYDRMGLDNEFTEILNIRVPLVTIPVKPGRNLAIIIEVAAMNNRQKKMGYNAAQELMNNLGIVDDSPASTKVQISGLGYRKGEYFE